MNDEHTGLVIVGAGIIGLTAARELIRRGFDSIVIIDKEPELGRHASGRNSGVLHAGIYYAPDSLKARSCLNGNRLMKAYCREKGLPLLETGKVVVARSEAELDTLQILYARALANGARVRLLSETELARIEPNARTCRTALLSLDTAVVDPKRILIRLRNDLEETGKVRFRFRTKFLGVEGDQRIRTSNGMISYDRLINTAGSGCELVAQAFGLAFDYRMVPFKGIYYKMIPEKAHLVNGSIYPVPDIRNPFLGVHFTRNVHGDVYVGPTAIPAFGRENYGMVSGIDAEAPRILLTDAALLFTNPKFRSVALTEPRKYFLPWFYRDAAALVHSLDPEDLMPSPKVGIRPQLVNWKTRELVMDFMMVRDRNTLHVLNPISPAFTSSMDLAKTIADRIESDYSV
ncbi:MAG: L-2-hydroxyglutarate oxidase [Thermodesulfobacteriota bacterium]